MNVRKTRARFCAALFISLFTSISFAQVSAVTDRTSFAGDDFIDWQESAVDPAWTWIASPSDIFSDGGMAVTVAQSVEANSGIIQEPSAYFSASNIADGDFLYYTYAQNNDSNEISFSNFDGVDICGLGTQLAPYEAGPFVARIEAFNGDGSIGYFDVASSTTNPEAAFVGISTTDPMSRVEVSIRDTTGGSYAALYVINQVDLKACAEEPPVPEVPVVSCEGFGAPMDKFPVKTKKNRVLPLKMELFDADGFEVTDIELVAAPVVDVMFTSSTGGDPVDVTSDVTSVGKASEGNQFVFADDIWQFKLSSKPYTASGTYVVSVVSGDEFEYVIDPTCVTEFVKK